eukprot:TRINITY_DN4667_c0_g1_i2.p1 TRINITY_DN4667_c0_g1~~TRINITY_DN4667_c0_g1_i2.p1  ORF type:complete len:154 (-),score=46.45 TRINITY_DN4667_c0_g1_i2:147-608(-)
MMSSLRPVSVSTAKFYSVRLVPGDEVLKGLQSILSDHGLKAAFIAGCVGSLTDVAIRFAGNPNLQKYSGKFEVVSLIGTLDDSAPHLHLCVSDENGSVIGGHLLEGCTVRTTLEVVLGELEDVTFARKHCELSGYPELIILPRSQDHPEDGAQ